MREQKRITPELSVEAGSTDVTAEYFKKSLAALLVDDRDSSCAVLIIGMDRFKALNESLGHATGDKVLGLVSKRIQTILRGKDSFCRLHGDQFALLLHPAPTFKDTGNIAERISEVLHRAYLAEGQIVHTSASVGIALSPQDGTLADTLLKRAGIALQRAKLSGTGKVLFFEGAMEDRIVALHALTLDLRKALLLRQLEVHYQPQIDIRSREITGFEALLRWRHPELGWISPGDFIPLAEEIGLINMIGEWVLRTACEQAARLPPGLVIAVNASPVQFRTETFFATVESALSAANIPATRLEIEITEGVLLRNADSVRTLLTSLRGIGVRLAMDDFGTGFSSLGQLAQFPFDVIKIDRSLIGETAKQRAIVRAVATLGHGMDMSVVAEGVENEVQLANAAADGCDVVQGFHYSKAVPASEIDALLARFPRNIHKSGISLGV